MIKLIMNIQLASNYEWLDRTSSCIASEQPNVERLGRQQGKE